MRHDDVDTTEVLRRCTATIYPRANFLDVLEGNPDLYGPFWIATTVDVKELLVEGDAPEEALGGGLLAGAWGAEEGARVGLGFGGAGGGVGECWREESVRML